MNLPNKITMSRIVMAIIILVLLTIPWYQMGIEFPTILLNGNVVVNIKYIIAGIIFVIAAISDCMDGRIARSRNLVTDFGKVMDAIADKILVNGLLVILAYDGFISVAIPVIIITRDIIVDSCKMASGNKGKVVAASTLGKIKTVFMLIGVTLILFYNIPFEFIGINVAYILVIIATLLSVISGCQYYINTKDIIFDKK
ncbi:MAG: CDP-diacylglycerol--glycerol-3-phosphate 3-phosphatidyltransferase [Bacilli bacterium]|nr:CDP-diacylglycerol--glycerol-3-phosphate 3-phosphatidyltransferase [Bacilli bacterium]